MDNKIHIAGLNKTFQSAEGVSVHALENISISVVEGEFVCIVGPSGCGKTTLVRILAGLEAADSGTFEIERKSRRESELQPLLSMVFQEQSVFPWMNVYDNVAFGLAVRGVPKEVQRQVVESYIAKVGLTRFAKAYPHQLSGGMKQRVNLARAFANDPEVLLMDEPFAALDEQTKLLMQEELLRIWGETRKTVVYITHSIDEAIILGDRVVIMTARPGRIKTVLEIDFPRPRDVLQVKGSARFAELVLAIGGALMEEVLKAKAEEEGQGRDRTLGDERREAQKGPGSDLMVGSR